MGDDGYVIEFTSDELAGLTDMLKTAMKRAGRDASCAAAQVPRPVTASIRSKVRLALRESERRRLSVGREFRGHASAEAGRKHREG